MTDLSHLNGQISEAREQFQKGCETLTETREKIAQKSLEQQLKDTPQTFKVLGMLLRDEQYLALERSTDAARAKYKESAAVPTGPYVKNTPEEAQLLRDENDRRATWGKKEVDGKGSKQEYIMRLATANGVSIEGAEAIQVALNTSLERTSQLEQGRETVQPRIARRDEGASR